MTSNGDAFGSLAALFTTGTGDPAPASPGSVPDVTTVLVGNLPVMAGLWTTQLAELVARSAGPTALVRLERGDVTIELMRAEGRQVPPAGPGAVAAWLPRASSQVRRWLLCVPAEMPPAEVLEAGNAITVLTGSDEAAITGAYLRLKHLADEAIHRGAPMERVGLVVVGATPDQAAQASARLADAARSFLGIEVESTGCLPRIERVESSARATYAAADCPSLVEFTRGLSRAHDSAVLRFEQDPPADPRTGIDIAVEPKRTAGAAFGSAAPSSPFAPRSVASTPFLAAPAVAPVAAPAAAPAPAVAPMPAVVPAAAVAAAPAASAVPPAPAAAPTVSHAAAPRSAAPATSAPTAVPARAGVELPARLVPLLPGLRPLGTTCPIAPEIELGIDAQHVLHVVGRVDQLARVRAARNWASMHRELLGLAFPELGGGFEVRERILLSDAREAAALHGAGVVLDALVVADTPSGRIQVIVPLNDASSCG